MNTKNKTGIMLGILVVVATLVGGVFWISGNKKEIETANNETIDPYADWQTYSNEEYNFEFKYPSSIAPISFSEKTSMGCSLALVFYDSKIVSDSLAMNPPEKKPNAKSKLLFCLLDNNESGLSIRDFIKKRYYSEQEPFFEETKAGEFEAMESVNQPGRGYMLVAKLSNKLFLELGNRDNLEIFNQIKPTFKSIHQ